MPERRITMDLLYAVRDLGVADPAADTAGEQTVRAALAQEIDQASAARRPGRARRRRPRLLAGAMGAVAASATAVALLLSVSASPPPAFAVTRQNDGSVSLKINRATSIAEVNGKLAAMGIERIGKHAMAAGEDLSSIPSCSSIPPGWKGEWVQMAGSSSGPGYSISETVPPGTWVLVYCASGQVPADLGGTSSATTGNTGSGNTGGR
jgi:hypothetical protein